MHSWGSYFNDNHNKKLWKELNKGQAKMAVYRMQCNGNRCKHHAMKHTKIYDTMRCAILEMPPGRIPRVMETETP